MNESMNAANYDLIYMHTSQNVCIHVLKIMHMVHMYTHAYRICRLPCIQN